VVFRADSEGLKIKVSGIPEGQCHRFNCPGLHVSITACAI